MYLRRLTIDELFNAEAANNPEMAGAFKVYCICDSDDPLDSELLRSVAQMETVDRKAFMNGLRMLLKVANTGNPLESHYDKKQCHETHSFKHGKKSRKIMRIRTSDLRTLFFYGSDKELLLIDAFPKHTDKISDTQKKHAEDLVARFIDEEHIFVKEQNDAKRTK